MSLVESGVPKQLYRMYTFGSAERMNFLNYVGTYNNRYTFTSFGVKFDRALCRRNKEIYTFQGQWQIYHYISDLVPIDGRHSYLQLYFYVTKYKLKNRVSNSKRSSPSIIAQFMAIISIYPYSFFFRALGDSCNLEKYEI